MFTPCLNQIKLKQEVWLNGFVDGTFGGLGDSLPSACKADALNQLSYAPNLFKNDERAANIYTLSLCAKLLYIIYVQN